VIQGHIHAARAHLQPEGVAGSANQEGQPVADNGVGVGVGGARGAKHAVQVLCSRGERGSIQ
jgi:hypothetical protein